MRAAYITATLSHSSATTARSCVTYRMLRSSSRCMVREDAEDLLLDGHVQRGRRLVAEDEARVAGERHGDHHALAHAAGELVRVRAIPPFGVGDADAAHQFDRFAARLPAAVAQVDADGLGDLVHRRASPGSAPSWAPGRSCLSPCPDGGAWCPCACRGGPRPRRARGRCRWRCAAAGRGWCAWWSSCRTPIRPPAPAPRRWRC